MFGKPQVSRNSTGRHQSFRQLQKIRSPELPISRNASYHVSTSDQIPYTGFQSKI
jgi:hypothetical protein